MTFDHFDMILKVEMILYQVKQLFFWVSFTELISFIVSTVLLLSLDKVFILILCFGHLLRALAGFFIYNSMPNINEFIRDVKKNIDSERLMQSLDVTVMQQQVVDGVGESLKGQFIGLQDEVGAKAMQAYAILTVVCVITDIIAFFLILLSFKDSVQTEQLIAVIMLNIAFWYCFYKWGAFARTLKGKLPKDIQKHVTAALSAANVPGFKEGDAPGENETTQQEGPTLVND